jgi:hypothetical protein
LAQAQASYVAGSPVPLPLSLPPLASVLHAASPPRIIESAAPNLACFTPLRACMSSLVDAAAALSVSDERPDSFEVEKGVHVKLDKKGDGVSPVEGDTVQVNYSGRVKGKKLCGDQPVSRVHR